MSKLTIITINYNNSAGLQKTINSVLSQTFKDYEYIIVDGGSTDGSKEIIEKYKDRLTYGISEKDTGIYNAMNKGIAKATGEYLLFLNSGDYLANNTAIPKILNCSKNIDIIYGAIYIEDKGIKKLQTYPEKLNFSYFLQYTLPHQSTFIKRELFNTVGLYNESFKTTSDWEFFLKAICKYNATYKYIPEPVAVYNYDGISAQPENWDWIKVDKEKALENHFPAFLEDYKTLENLMILENKLKNIENSRFWNLRNKLIFSKIGKLLLKNKQ